MKLKILGPPGTGKTTRLMELLEKEIAAGTKPDRIAFLTFTRAAREEALARTGKKEDEFPFLRTIHSICYRQLNIIQDQIVKPKNLRVFGKFLGVKLNGNVSDPWVEEYDRSWEPPTRDDLLLQANHCGRHRGILLKEAIKYASAEIDYKYAVWFTKAYKNWKATEGLVDYTDLLMRYIDFGNPLDIDVIFVDEAQDLSSLQWEVVSKLGANAKKWIVAGDDDQAIFNWAGADSSVFQNLEVDETEVLGQSYRCSKAVHEVAMKVASRINTRLVKEYKPTDVEGEVANVGYLTAVDFKGKTFVLFRNHYRGQELSRQLRDAGIPFVGHGSPLTNIDVREALFAWYTLFKKGEINSRLMKKLLKYMDKNYTFVEKVKENKVYTMKDVFARKPEWYEWPRYMIGLPGKDVIGAFIDRAGFLRTSKPQTELLSIHQSKGREANTVVLDTEISRAIYDAVLVNGDDEHRVWYTACTRAKERLFLLLPDGGYSYRVY
jgi:superfamily I DNA/RNA helicase